MPPAEHDDFQSRRDPGVRALLLLMVALQAFAWAWLEGYQLADSVEYMDRALIAATGQELEGRRAVRSFAFSLGFYPMFKVADLLGVEDLRPLVWVGRALQMALALALLLTTVRIAARLAGRSAGLAAGFLIALNPVLLRYSVSPVAGVASALCLALGLERFLWPSPNRRSSFIGGLWLGLAVLCAYKSLLVVVALSLGVVLRDRWRVRTAWTGLCAGVSVAVGLQAVLDRIVYGRWGGSLFGYVMDNASSRITDWFWQIHLATSGKVSEVARGVALWFYERQNAFLGYELDASHLERRMLRAPGWYIEHLPEMLVWPALVVCALGVLRALRRPAWPTSILVLVVSVFAYVTSTKGDKSFRLWLPIVPVLALLGALGWAALWGGRAAGLPRRVAAAGLLILGLPLCIEAYVAANPRQNGSYWRAMEYVNQAADTDADERPRVGCSFHWAIFLRAAPGIDLVRGPTDLDRWPGGTAEGDAEDSGAAETRLAIRAHLESLDWLIVHQSVLTLHPELTELVNRIFTVEAAFYVQEQHAPVGPVYALRTRSAGAGGRSFFALREPGTLVLERSDDTPPPQAFGGGFDEGPLEILTLQGWDIEPIPGTEQARWLTYHWTTPTGLARDYKLVDRITAPDAHHSFQNNHWPAYGTLPTSAWKPGQVVSESYLFLPSGEPFAVETGFRPLGGPYRRGDLIPASLWMRVIDEDENGGVVAELAALGPLDTPTALALGELSARVLSGEPTDAALTRVARGWGWDEHRLARITDPWGDPYDRWLRDGLQRSKDGLFEVGRFFVAVDESLRLPDDGKPLVYEGYEAGEMPEPAPEDLSLGG